MVLIFESTWIKYASLIWWYKEFLCLNYAYVFILYKNTSMPLKFLFFCKCHSILKKFLNCLHLKYFSVIYLTIALHSFKYNIPIFSYGLWEYLLHPYVIVLFWTSTTLFILLKQCPLIFLTYWILIFYFYNSQFLSLKLMYQEQLSR